MATNPKDTAARKFVGKFARTLLAATCLTAATGGAALAGSIAYTEGVGSTPSDFPNTAPATSLVAAANPGTTTVGGTLSGSDPADFFELTGLGSGTFTVSSSINEGGNATVFVFDTLSNLLEGGGSNQTNGPGLFGFTSPGVNPLNFGAMAIPGNGDLVFEVERWHEQATSYTISVATQTSGVPEPSTVGMVGLGLAGALTLSRKRRKQ